MKKIILTFALLLSVSLVFSNTSEKTNGDNFELLTSNDLVSSNDNTFSFEYNQVLNTEESTELKDCTLKGNFTITFSDGSQYSWEGTLTIVGQSCAEFLKEMMKE